MSKISELESERETRLSQIMEEYHARQEYAQSKMDEYKSQAAEKQLKGEDCSAEIDKWSEYKGVQDRNFDEYKSTREDVYGYYEEKIKEAEQDYDYEY